MAKGKKRLGKHAVGDVLLKYIHPSAWVRQHFINPTSQQRLQGCLVTSEEQRIVGQKQQECVVFTHPDHPNQTLYAVKRWFKVTMEGPEDLLFSTNTPGRHTANVNGVELPPEVLKDPINIDAETTQNLAGILEIDDDNEPAPENIPTNNDSDNNVQYDGWTHDGTCFRKKTDAVQQKARLILPVVVDKPTVMQLF
eukprot:scaffold130_cov151-Amphora_coffeaeformis.AAC.3